MMAAEEASLRGGWFERIIKFYERWLRRAFEHPVVAGRVLRHSDRRFPTSATTRWAAICCRPWTRAASFSTT